MKHPLTRTAESKTRKTDSVSGSMTTAARLTTQEKTTAIGGSLKLHWPECYCPGIHHPWSCNLRRFQNCHVPFGTRCGSRFLLVAATLSTSAREHLYPGIAFECGSFEIRIQVKNKAPSQPGKSRRIKSSTQGEDHVDRGLHLDGLVIEQVRPITPRLHRIESRLLQHGRTAHHVEILDRTLL